jgi:hypothetical protein
MTSHTSGSLPSAQDDNPSYLESLAGLLGDGEPPPRGFERVFKVEGENVVWTCAGCGRTNDLRASGCPGCGLSFVATARRIADEETTERVQLPERVAGDTLRGMAAASGAGPLAIPLMLAAALVGIGKGVLRAVARRHHR